MIEVFYEIAYRINRKFCVIPLLYGSTGLQLLINENLMPDDIDVLIPRFLLLQNGWGELLSFMQNQGYELIDLHEHTFRKGRTKIAFAEIDDLEEFANIKLTDSTIKETDGAFYFLLTLSQYLNVYVSSLNDGYRRQKNNGKDLQKIEVIKSALNPIK